MCRVTSGRDSLAEGESEGPFGFRSQDQAILISAISNELLFCVSPCAKVVNLSHHSSTIALMLANSLR
jgi:hypothetical protein